MFVGKTASVVMSQRNTFVERCGAPFRRFARWVSYWRWETVQTMNQIFFARLRFTMCPLPTVLLFNLERCGICQQTGQNRLRVESNLGSRQPTCFMFTQQNWRLRVPCVIVGFLLSPFLRRAPRRSAARPAPRPGTGGHRVK